MLSKFLNRNGYRMYQISEMKEYTFYAPYNYKTCAPWLKLIFKNIIKKYRTEQNAA